MELEELIRSSVIFSEAQKNSLLKRLTGNKRDSTGIYSKRVKPKVVELTNWAEHQEALRKLLE